MQRSGTVCLVCVCFVFFVRSIIRLTSWPSASLLMHPVYVLFRVLSTITSSLKLCKISYSYVIQWVWLWIIARNHKLYKLLIFLTGCWAHRWINHFKFVMHGQCDTRLTVTFPAVGHHRRVTGTNLYCLVTEARVWTTFPRLLPGRVTGQLADTLTRGLPTRGLVNSRTGQLADVAGSSCSFK